VSGLATAQAVQGHTVSVLTTDTLTPTLRIATLHETIDGVNVIRVRNRIGGLRRVNLSTPLGMGAALHALSTVDIVHCHELRTVENLIALYSLPRTVRIVVSPHGTLPIDTGRSAVKRVWDRLFGRMLAIRFDGICALTASEANDARTYWSRVNIAAPPIAIVSNGVTLPPPKVEAHSEALNVLFLGRLHERKGLQYLIPAFAQVAIFNAHLRLTIGGPDEGMLARAVQLAAEYGAADRVTFAGMLDDVQRDRALAEADLFVLPAVGEGLSMAALEAMAAGVPVILTPGCHLPEVVPRGVGLIVPREITSLAAAMRELLTDRARRVSMGAAGRAWMAADYTWEAVARRAVDFYAQLL